MKEQFLEAIDACSTLKEIQVTDAGNHLSHEEMRLLQEGRIGRNNELRRFKANPSNLSERELLKLMLQLGILPNGTLQAIVHKLPSAGIFPGQKMTVQGDSLKGKAPTTPVNPWSRTQRQMSRSSSVRKINKK